MDENFIPECYIDTNLIETLVPPKKHYNHQKGCGTVTKVMKEQFADRFAVGIIDKDKREVDYLKEFTIVCNNGSLILHKHQTLHHYIIQIIPAMERFIIKSVQDTGLSLEDFELPSDINKVKKISKTVNSKNDQRFKKLFKALIKSDSVEMKRLASWISYLKENNYNADMEKLAIL